MTLAVALAAGGCTTGMYPTAAAPAAAVMVAPPDPVATFAGSVAPGQEGVVVLPESGTSVRVRVTRAYYAASGRECREVQLYGVSEQLRLVCRLGDGWVSARPLMQGRGRL